jgi:hypothetical protein
MDAGLRKIAKKVRDKNIAKSNLKNEGSFCSSSTAINNIHTKIGMVESPFETDQSLKKRLAKMRNEHTPHGAESFDYAL